MRWRLHTSAGLTDNPASNITLTSFDANWSALSGNPTYFLDVATDSNFTSMLPGCNNLNVGSATSYTVSGLNCETTYYYRVRAENSCGTSGNSNTISITTNSCKKCLAIGGTNSDKAESIIRTSNGGYAWQVIPPPSGQEIGMSM